MSRDGECTVVVTGGLDFPVFFVITVKIGLKCNKLRQFGSVLYILLLDYELFGPSLAENSKSHISFGVKSIGIFIHISPT